MGTPPGGEFGARIRAMAWTLCSMLTATVLAQQAAPPVRVFVLAGQSNMEGFGAIHQADAAGRELPGTLRALLADPKTAATCSHLVDTRPAAAPQQFTVRAANAWFGDPAPGTRKQLALAWTIDGKPEERTIDEGAECVIAAAPARVQFTRAVYGALPDGPQADVLAAVRRIAGSAAIVWRERDDVAVAFGDRRGQLRPGFGANDDLFGIELQFGQILGDRCEEPVLLVKTAWGGKSLYADFRPPSAGGKVGPCYELLLQQVRAVLADPGVAHAPWRGRAAMLSGLVWWHGWNDGCDPEHAVPEYEANLVHLIRDLRRDLAVADLPVVVAELTGPWVDPTEPQWRSIRAQQAAAAKRDEWRGTVTFVPTAAFVRPEAQSPGGWACHEFNNAETYLLVGEACGRAMVPLLTGR